MKNTILWSLVLLAPLLWTTTAHALFGVPDFAALAQRVTKARCHRPVGSSDVNTYRRIGHLSCSCACHSSLHAHAGAPLGWAISRPIPRQS